MPTSLKILHLHVTLITPTDQESAAESLTLTKPFSTHVILLKFQKGQGHGGRYNYLPLFADKEAAGGRD